MKKCDSLNFSKATFKRKMVISSMLLFSVFLLTGCSKTTDDISFIAPITSIEKSGDKTTYKYTHDGQKQLVTDKKSIVLSETTDEEIKSFYAGYLFPDKTLSERNTKSSEFEGEFPLQMEITLKSSLERRMLGKNIAQLDISPDSKIVAKSENKFKKNFKPLTLTAPIHSIGKDSNGQTVVEYVNQGRREQITFKDDGKSLFLKNISDEQIKKAFAYGKIPLPNQSFKLFDEIPVTFKRLKSVTGSSKAQIQFEFKTSLEPKDAFIEPEGNYLNGEWQIGDGKYGYANTITIYE